MGSTLAVFDLFYFCIVCVTTWLALFEFFHRWHRNEMAEIHLDCIYIELVSHPSHLSVLFCFLLVSWFCLIWSGGFDCLCFANQCCPLRGSGLRVSFATPTCHCCARQGLWRQCPIFWPLLLKWPLSSVVPKILVSTRLTSAHTFSFRQATTKIFFSTTFKRTLLWHHLRQNKLPLF